MALARDAVGLGGGGHRLAALGQLRRECLLAQRAVGHLLQRARQRALVARHGFLVAGFAGAQLAAQASAIEQRQRDRRPDAADVRSVLAQQVQPQRLHADKGRQVDVGVELGALLLDPAGLRLGLEPACDHIGPPAQQVERELRRQAERLLELDAGPLDRQSAVGSGADQQRNPVPLQADLFVELQQRALGGRAPGVGLAHAGAVFHPVVEALGQQGGGLAAHLDRLQRRVAAGEQPAQLGVGAGDARRQQQACLGPFGLAGLALGGRCRQRGAVAAPEVELPAEVQRRAAVVVPAVGFLRAREQVVVAELFLGDRGVGAELRAQRGSRALGRGFGQPQARRCHRQVGRAAQGFIDQGLELGVAIAGPPALDRPVGLGRAQCLRALQVGRAGQGAALGQVGQLGTCRQGHEAAQGQQ